MLINYCVGFLLSLGKKVFSNLQHFPRYHRRSSTVVILIVLILLLLSLLSSVVIVLVLFYALTCSQDMSDGCRFTYTISSQYSIIFLTILVESFNSSANLYSDFSIFGTVPPCASYERPNYNVNFLHFLQLAVVLFFFSSVACGTIELSCLQSDVSSFLVQNYLIRFSC